MNRRLDKSFDYDEPFIALDDIELPHDFFRRSNKIPTIDEITFTIKTFNRPDCVVKCITSIQKFYPGANIIIADDGKLKPNYSQFENITVITQPFDSGHGKGRNEILNRVKTEYMVFLDDDYIFYEETDILKMAKNLVENRADVVGGRWKGCCIEASKMHYDPYTSTCSYSLLPIDNDVDQFVPCDRFTNFFIARTKALRDIGGWWNNVKIGDHTAMMFKMKWFGLRMGVNPTIQIIHDHQGGPAYNGHRRRVNSNYSEILTRLNILHFIRHGRREF